MADPRIKVTIRAVVDPLTARRMWTDYMFGVLVEAQKRRREPAMQDLVSLGEVSELRWVLHERAQMLRHVNKAREGLGYPPVSEEAVHAAERQAEGHSDYTRKWALYCADLILSSGVDTP